MVSNLGDATATGPVTVTHELVPELSATRVASDDAVCSVAGQAVTCVAAEDLDPGEAISTELETAITAPSGTQLANTASVAVAGGEIVVSNKVSNDSFVVGTCLQPELHCSSSCGPASFS